MKAERRKIKIHETLLDSIKLLHKYGREIGGGANLDKSRKKIKTITYFMGDSDSRLESDGHYYDIQFHTHPVKDTSNTCEMILAKIPSPEDVAYLCTTQVSELIFPPRDPFYMEVFDVDLYNSKRDAIRRDAKKEGKKHESQYDYYYYHFKPIFSAAFKECKKNTSSDEDACRSITKAWKRILETHGITIKRIDPRKLEIEVTK